MPKIMRPFLKRWQSFLFCLLSFKFHLTTPRERGLVFQFSQIHWIRWLWRLLKKPSPRHPHIPYPVINFVPTSAWFHHYPQLHLCSFCSSLGLYQTKDGAINTWKSPRFPRRPHRKNVIKTSNCNLKFLTPQQLQIKHLEYNVCPCSNPSSTAGIWCFYMGGGGRR